MVWLLDRSTSEHWRRGSGKWDVRHGPMPMSMAMLPRLLLLFVAVAVADAAGGKKKASKKKYGWLPAKSWWREDTFRGQSRFDDLLKSLGASYACLEVIE